MIEPKKLAASAVVIILSAGFASADILWTGTSDRNAIKVEGAKIQQFANGNLLFTTTSGSQIEKAFDELQQISVDGETSFNTAETAFAAKDYPTAIGSYKQSLDGSSKSWVQLRSAIRLCQAGKASGHYDAEVMGYAALVQSDPTIAVQNKPTELLANSQYLDSALNALTKSLGAPKLDNSQKTALLTLQLQINRVQGNSSQANVTLQQLAALGSANPADIAALKLASANVQYDAKQYDQAISTIDLNRASFVQPDQQVGALYLLAQAKFAIDADKTDPNTLKDLALGYMRVVTFGSKLPDQPHVADSLYQVAQIEEKLKEPQSALVLYQQLMRDKAFAASPIVAQAKIAADRLGKNGGASK